MYPEDLNIDNFRLQVENRELSHSRYCKCLRLSVSTLGSGSLGAEEQQPFHGRQVSRKGWDAYNVM